MKGLLTLTIAYVLILNPVFVDAEIVHLSDGSSLVGKIKEMKKEKINIQTDYGDFWIEKSKIKDISYASEGNTLAASTAVDESYSGNFNEIIDPANDSAKGKYVANKLGIRTLDIYEGTSSKSGALYYSKLLNMAFESSTEVSSLTPRQRWIITKGGIDIRELDFLYLVEPKRAEVLESKINTQINLKKQEKSGFYTLGVLGSIGTLIGCFPLDMDEAHSEWRVYGTTNGILLTAGILSGLIGYLNAIGDEKDQAALEKLKIDPLIHTDSIEYTKGKIKEYNQKLKVELKIIF